MRLRPATSRTPCATSSKSPIILEQQDAFMLNDRMLVLNVIADPGATSKQKSFANDILRNKFTSEIEHHGGSAKTLRYFKLYEEQCLKASLGTSAKAQANRYLAAGNY